MFLIRAAHNTAHVIIAITILLFGLDLFTGPQRIEHTNWIAVPADLIASPTWPMLQIVLAVNFGTWLILMAFRQLSWQNRN